jgi:hypothetical protein
MKLRQVHAGHFSPWLDFGTIDARLSGGGRLLGMLSLTGLCEPQDAADYGFNTWLAIFTSIRYNSRSVSNFQRS